MLKRKIISALNEWYENTDKNPLIVKGLRQIGKTTVVKEFGKSKYKNCFILDFRLFPEYKDIFDGNFDIDRIASLINALPSTSKVITNSRVVPFETLFIFDEIQDCPNARSSLKYFKEDGRFDVICTGSFLGVKGYGEEETNRGVPVGFEEHLTMYSLDFEEFLWANNVDEETIKLIKETCDQKKEIPLFLHNMFSELIRKYIIVGGLPKAVELFVKTKDFKLIRRYLKNLIESYKSDFGTHLNKDKEIAINEIEKAKAIKVFDSIPVQLAKENKKFKYSLLGKSARNYNYIGTINWLEDYGLIARCYNHSNIAEPIEMFKNEDEFKIYLRDIGLLSAMIEEESQFKIMMGDLGLGKGMIYENLIADAMYKNGKKLRYFSKDSGLEIDFITHLFNKLYIVEVKATNGKSKSASEVLKNSKYEVEDLLKISGSNIGFVEHKFTIPHYLAFYVFSKWI